MAQRNGYVSKETVARMEESGNNGERSVEWVRTEKKMDDCCGRKRSGIEEESGGECFVDGRRVCE